MVEKSDLQWVALMIVGIQISILGLALDAMLIVIAGALVTLVLYFGTFWPAANR